MSDSTAAAPTAARIIIVGGRAGASAKAASARSGGPLAGRLLRLGCQVVGVATGLDEVLALATRERPALALVDLHPGSRGGGIEAAERLQQAAGLGVVFFGAPPDAALLERALAIAPQGPLGYLHDPCTDLELRAGLGIALRRAAAERELRACRQAHHTLLAGIGEGVILVDGAVAVRYINARAEALTGWTNAQACGRPLDEVLQLREETGGRRLTGMMLAAAAGASGSASDDVAGNSWDGVPCLVAGRGGAEAPVEVSSALIGAPGQAIGLAITLHGLSERRGAEQRLRINEERLLLESEARLKLFIARAPVALALFDRDMRCIVASRRWLEDYRLGEASVVGSSIHDMFPDHPQRWTLLFRRALGGEAVRADEDRVEHADGRVQWLRWEVLPWHGSDGEAGGVVVLTEDITAAKGAAEQIKALNTGLERRVAERTAELAAARDEAERLARAKSQFLANMSHEIRTPLHAVLGLAGMGLRESAGRASHDTFQRIVDSGEYLLGVINTVLDLSKLEAGKQQAHERPFRLACVVAKGEAFAKLEAPKKGLASEVTLDPALPEWVQGDALRLQQILLNLLANAVKFTDRGGVRLTVRGDGEWTRFEVADTGVGIEADKLGQLFTPFEQLDSSTTRRFGGAGLGLMLSRSLAALMGGTITVSSHPGVGSTFTLNLRLPAAAAEAAQAAAAAAPGGDELPEGGERLRGLRVLAVDDVDINRMILEDLLLLEGARARIVESAAAGLQALAEPGPGFDVVLMDIQMPVMDGYEAAQRMRAIAPRLPIIGLTAHALAEERERCLAAGMVEHVSKPLDATVLVRAIRSHARRAPGAAEGAPAAPAAGGGERRGARRGQRRAAPPPGPEAAGAALAGRPPAREAPARALRLIDGRDRVAAAAGALIDWAALRARHASLPGFVDRLAGKALATQQRLPGQLRLAARAGDLAALRALAHDVAGMAGNLQAPRLVDLARAAEAAVVNWRGPDVALGLAGELADGVDELLRELQTHLQARRA